MARIARIGIDTSKSVFQLHGVDEREQVVLLRKLRRREFLAFFAKLEPTSIGLEACGGSHCWARQLQALGHGVVLIPPQHVKAYVARGKNDAADAAAICEAMSRPRIQQYLVPIKSAEQAAAQMLLGIREGLVRRRTQLANTIRGHAAEFGLVVPKGLDKIEPLLAFIADDAAVPALAKEMFAVLGREFVDLRVRTAEVDKKLKAFHAGNELTRRLATIPGVGPIGACLLATKIVNPHGFRSGRMCAAWIGLTPKDHSTAGKQRLGGITRAGDESLRSVLVTGATAYIQQVRRGRTVPSPWLAKLLAHKEPKPAAIALANKTARIAWKLMTTGQAYDREHAAASAMAVA